MSKSGNKESYFKRLRELAEVDKNEKTTAKNLSEGTLIDYKFANNGISYGIIKENHNYYIKKGNNKKVQDVYDFNYIGGLENIKDYQYGTLSEALKHRNFLFQTISETESVKVNPSMTKLILESDKKKKNEDETDDAIKKSADKASKLDVATEKEKAEDETPMQPEPTDEPDIDVKVDAEEPDVKADGDDVKVDTGEEPDVKVDAGEEGDVDVKVDDEGEVDIDVDDVSDEEINKLVGKLTHKVRQSEMEPVEVKSVLNSVIASFKEKLPEVEIEDRKRMAEKLLKVVDKPEDELEGQVDENTDEPSKDGDWVGTDADLDISLFEQGIIAKQPFNKDYDDEWFVLYKIDDDEYGSGWIRESDLDQIIKGEDWAKEEDINSFLETIGSSKEEWLQLPFVQKLSTLLNYWGYQNIMGSEYSPMSKEEAEKKINGEEINEDEREGLIEFEVPEWALSALINGDYSGLDNEEEQKINDFVEKVKNEYGNANFMAGDYDGGADDFGFKPSNDIDNLGSNVFGVYVMPDEDKMPQDDLNEEAERCDECGSFVEYVEANGYDNESIMTADDDEKANLISSYINAYNDGKNDGDKEVVELFMNETVKDTLMNEYGHDEYIKGLVKPEDQQVAGEERAKAINELNWGSAMKTGLKFGKKAGAGVADRVKKVGTDVANRVKKAGTDVANKAKEFGSEVKADYNRNVQDKVAGQVEKLAADLRKKIEDLNKRTVAGGGEPININSVLATISNQLRGKSGSADLSKYRSTNEGEDYRDEHGEKPGEPKGHSDKTGEAGRGRPEKKDEGELIENEDEFEDKDKENEPTFAAAADTLGVPSPVQDSPTNGNLNVTADANSKTVNVTLSEQKIRKYIRKRLLEMAGKKKSTINESQKSNKLKKLDQLIEREYKKALSNKK